MASARSSSALPLCKLALLSLALALAQAQTAPPAQPPAQPSAQPSAQPTQPAQPAQPAQQGPRVKISDEQLEHALSDKRYLMRQLKCALGEAPCDPVGRRLKSLAPLVLRGACPQCSPEEMRQIQRTLSHIQRHYPKEWNRIVKQYAGR